MTARARCLLVLVYLNILWLAYAWSVLDSERALTQRDLHLLTSAWQMAADISALNKRIQVLENVVNGQAVTIEAAKKQGYEGGWHVEKQGGGTP